MFGDTNSEYERRIVHEITKIKDHEEKEIPKTIHKIK